MMDYVQYNQKKSLQRRKAARRKKKIRRIKIVICEVLILAVMIVLVKGVWHSRNASGNGMLDKLFAVGGKSDIERFAKKHGLTLDDYPQDLIELYERNPETKEFVCEYPLKKDEEPEIDLSEYCDTDSVPLFMQWDERWGYRRYSGNVMGLTGCGPTCLSMVSVFLSGDTSMSPAKMAEFAEENGYAVEGSGTAWALFSEGGQKLGFDVTEIPLDESRIRENLEAGNPIVVSLGPGDFTTEGHFVVLTGYEDGKIRVNDPNSRKNSKKLWEFERLSGQIKALWVFR